MRVLNMIMAIALATSATRAGARVEDPELMRAIRSVNGRVSVRDRALLGPTQRHFGMAMAVSGLVSAGALLTAPKSRFFQLSRSIFELTFVADGLMALVPLIAVARLSDDPEDYRTERSLEYFFAMTIGRQYRIAHRDPELRRFLIELAAASGEAEQRLLRR